MSKESSAGTNSYPPLTPRDDILRLVYPHRRDCFLGRIVRKDFRFYFIPLESLPVVERCECRDPTQERSEIPNRSHTIHEQLERHRGVLAIILLKIQYVAQTMSAVRTYAEFHANCWPPAQTRPMMKTLREGVVGDDLINADCRSGGRNIHDERDGDEVTHPV